MPLVVTEYNIDALLREYTALSFSFVYRKLPPKDAARMQELEEAFAAIPDTLESDSPSERVSSLDILIENHDIYSGRDRNDVYGEE